MIGTFAQRLLERFEQQQHAPGVKPTILAKRLNKARQDAAQKSTR
jgi:hypothetical protein